MKCRKCEKEIRSSIFRGYCHDCYADWLVIHNTIEDQFINGEFDSDTKREGIV